MFLYLGGWRMKHVVSFSGGKDSTAMLLMMVEQNIPIDEVVYYSMGSWEWDEMLLHIEKIKNDIPSSIEFTELGDEEKLQYGFDKWGFPNFISILEEDSHFCKWEMNSRINMV